VLWKRGVLVIAAVAWMRGDALARGKHLDGSRGDPHINFGARKLIWNASNGGAPRRDNPALPGRCAIQQRHMVLEATV